MTPSVSLCARCGRHAASCDTESHHSLCLAALPVHLTGSACLQEQRKAMLGVSSPQLGWKLLYDALDQVQWQSVTMLPGNDLSFSQRARACRRSRAKLTSGPGS